MYFSDRITLRSATITTDADAYKVVTNTDVAVWANKKSATRSEFYAAQANKINISQVFEVHAEDYDNQTFIVDGSKVYKIERTYQKGEGIIELNCSDAKV